MKGRIPVSALKAASVYIILMTVTVIVADLFLPLKNFLAGITGHHWTAKGLLGSLIFIILIFIFNAKSGDDDLKKSINFVIISSVTGIIALMLFYTIHYFA